MGRREARRFRLLQDCVLIFPWPLGARRAANYLLGTSELFWATKNK